MSQHSITQMRAGSDAGADIRIRLVNERFRIDAALHRPDGDLAIRIRANAALQRPVESEFA